MTCAAPLAVDVRPALCDYCRDELPETRNWELPENAMAERLAGRLPIVSAAALYAYRPGGIVQRLIHSLKYYDRPDLGVAMGRELGRQIGANEWLADIAGIVPVPIHRKRLRQRGYNQAERIALGISEATDWPMLANALARQAFLGSQTKKTKEQRVENVARTFVAPAGRALDNRHILLVDDVMTTGATLDFCGHALLAAHPSLRISIATLAVTAQ